MRLYTWQKVRHLFISPEERTSLVHSSSEETEEDKSGKNVVEKDYKKKLEIAGPLVHTATLCTPGFDGVACSACAAVVYPCCPQLGRLDMFPFTVLDVESTAKGERRRKWGGDGKKKRKWEASSAKKKRFHNFSANPHRQTVIRKSPVKKADGASDRRSVAGAAQCGGKNTFALISLRGAVVCYQNKEKHEDGETLTSFALLRRFLARASGHEAPRHELRDALPRDDARRLVLKKSIIRLAILRHAVVVSRDAEVLGGQVAAQGPAHRVIRPRRVARGNVVLGREERLLGGDAVEVASASGVLESLR